MKTNNFFYFSQINKYLICDVESCSKSERTFDMPFFALANNEKLLNKLALYFIQGNYGVRYTYESRAKWFCGYLSSLSLDDDNKKYNKLITNPTVRLLIEDETLLKEVKDIVTILPINS